MKAKNLTILVVLAVVLVGLAYITSSRKTKITTAPAVMGQYVLPSLQEPETLNNIEKIIFLFSGTTVTVTKVNNVWVAPEKYNYPVDFGKVRDFLLLLAELKIGQVVPPGKGQHEALNLEHTGTLVECKDKTGKKIASLIAGKEHMKAPSSDTFFGGRFSSYPDGRYIAVDEKVYLVTETFSNLPENEKGWLDNDLVNVSSSEIIKITVTDPKGKTLTLKRPDDGEDLTLEELSRKEEMDTSKVNSLASVLSYLTFTDVADPNLSDKETGLDKPLVYIAKTKQGKIYAIKIGGSPEESDDRYLRISASLEPPPDSTGEETEKKKEELEKSTREVRELNEKVGKWTYLVASYKVAGVTTKRDDLVKKKEK